MGHQLQGAPIEQHVECGVELKSHATTHAQGPWRTSAGDHATERSVDRLKTAMAELPTHAFAPGASSSIPPEVEGGACARSCVTP